MKVGYAQFSPVLGDLEENRRRVESLAARAEGAQVLVFPELCNSGYNFAGREEALAAAERVPDGPFVRLLRRLSQEYRCFLVSGVCEQDEGRLYNSSVLVGPDGLIGTYRKAHLFWNEKDLFQPGDTGFPVFDLDLATLDPGRPLDPPDSRDPGRIVRLGMLICFDWQFPEVWRVLALRGAQLACHPSNLVLPGKAQKAVPLHAMLNRLFVVLANRTGSERDLHFTGRSLVAGPGGEILAESGPDEDDVRVIEIDPAEADNKAVTPRNDLIADRRPELYAALIADRRARYAGRAAAEGSGAPPSERPTRADRGQGGDRGR